MGSLCCSRGSERSRSKTIPLEPGSVSRMELVAAFENSVEADDVVSFLTGGEADPGRRSLGEPGEDCDSGLAGRLVCLAPLRRGCSLLGGASTCKLGGCSILCFT